MVKSMTGFGRGEYLEEGLHFIVEIKTVNHRYNDIIIKKPKNLNYIEEKIRKTIKNHIKRGRVEVFINLEYVDESNIFIKPDIQLAMSYINAINQLSKETGVKNEITIESLLKFPDILKIEQVDDDETRLWNTLKKALLNALENLNKMRINEGNELMYDILERNKYIKEMVLKIEDRSNFVVIEYKEKLLNRIKEIIDDTFKLDENRLENEIVFYADRSSITEEIVRLYSHINQLNEILTYNEPIGRKLDFLVQEMNREINTISSKSSDVNISKLVIEIKSEIEKIREQIQNIE